MFKPELDLVLFECDCIHSDYGYCNVSVTNGSRQVHNTGTNGYIQLLAGNYTIECVSLNTSRVVRDVIVSLLEKRTNIIYSTPSTISKTSTNILPSSSFMPSTSRKYIIAHHIFIIIMDFFSCGRGKFRIGYNTVIVLHFISYCICGNNINLCGDTFAVPFHL